MRRSISITPRHQQHISVSYDARGPLSLLEGVDLKWTGAALDSRMDVAECDQVSVTQLMRRINPLSVDDDTVERPGGREQVGAIHIGRQRVLAADYGISYMDVPNRVAPDSGNPTPQRELCAIPLSIQDCQARHVRLPAIFLTTKWSAEHPCGIR